MEDTLYTLEYDKLQKFLLMGKCDFIIQNKRNEHRINFLIKKDKEDDTVLYVSYKSYKWVYIGFIKRNLEEESFEYHTNKKNIKVEEEKSKTFHTLLKFIFEKNKLPNNVDVFYSGRCSKCGRKLTNPIYIAIGIGKECLENEL